MTNAHANNTLRIQALVERYGVAAQSLRNWEDQGIIPPALRTPGGHRRYGSQHVAALDQLFGLADKGRGADDGHDDRASSEPEPAPVEDTVTIPRPVGEAQTCVAL